MPQDMTRAAGTKAYPLPSADAASLGFRVEQLDRLCAFIQGQIDQRHYPGAQIALARHGKLAMTRTFGNATTVPARKAADDTLWLLYSNTKVVLATTMWALAEQGAFRFGDKVSDHVPEFAKNGKRDITVFQVITHQAGFPNAVVPKAGWDDHKIMREVVSKFSLEWTPGSRVHYHGLSAHWTLATLIEAVTGRDFRDVVRETSIEPLGLGADLFMGVSQPAELARVSDMHMPPPTGIGAVPEPDHNAADWRRAGIPGGGGYGTARGMVALYQTMLAGGTLGGHRLVSPRTLQYAIRNWTGDRVDDYMGMPMHRGLGPHLRGDTANVRGMGAFASPRTFGHGGVGTSYCWGDPDSGVSFAYLTNNRIPDPWHSRRLDMVANFVHTSIL